MRDRAGTESERTSFGMGVVAVASASDTRSSTRSRVVDPGTVGHREGAPARIDAPSPSFEFEDELERLLASAGRPRVHA